MDWLKIFQSKNKKSYQIQIAEIPTVISYNHEGGFNKTALYIAGCVVVNWNLKFSQPMIKAIIEQKGANQLGNLYLYPEKLISKNQSLDRICNMLGGITNEKNLLPNFISDSKSSLNQAIKLAQIHVNTFGSFINSGKNILLQEEVRILIQFQLERAQIVLQKNKDNLNKIANELKQKKVLIPSEIEKLIGKKTH